jgi:hypothetical protein
LVAFGTRKKPFTLNYSLRYFSWMPPKKTTNPLFKSVSSVLIDVYSIFQLTETNVVRDWDY